MIQVRFSLRWNAENNGYLIHCFKNKIIYEILPSCIEIYPAHVLVDAAVEKTPDNLKSEEKNLGM